MSLCSGFINPYAYKTVAVLPTTITSFSISVVGRVFTATWVLTGGSPVGMIIYVYSNSNYITQVGAYSTDGVNFLTTATSFVMDLASLNTPSGSAVYFRLLVSSTKPLPTLDIANCDMWSQANNVVSTVYNVFPGGITVLYSAGSYYITMTSIRTEPATTTGQTLNIGFSLTSSTGPFTLGAGTITITNGAASYTTGAIFSNTDRPYINYSAPANSAYDAVNTTLQLNPLYAYGTLNTPTFVSSTPSTITFLMSGTQPYTTQTCGVYFSTTFFGGYIEYTEGTGIYSLGSTYTITGLITGTAYYIYLRDPYHVSPTLMTSTSTSALTTGTVPIGTLTKSANTCVVPWTYTGYASTKALQVWLYTTSWVNVGSSTCGGGSYTLSGLAAGNSYQVALVVPADGDNVAYNVDTSISTSFTTLINGAVLVGSLSNRFATSCVVPWTFIGYASYLPVQIWLYTTSWVNVGSSTCGGGSFTLSGLTAGNSYQVALVAPADATYAAYNLTYTTTTTFTTGTASIGTITPTSTGCTFTSLFTSGYTTAYPVTLYVSTTSSTAGFGTAKTGYTLGTLSTVTGLTSGTPYWLKMVVNVDSYVATVVAFTTTAVAAASATGGSKSAPTNIGGTNYYIHTFAVGSTFVVTGGSLVANILVVGGGGAGGQGNGTGNGGNGGGGGGGTVQLFTTQTVSAGSYTITIGAGSVGVSAGDASAAGSSQFGTLLPSNGGGNGGWQDNGVAPFNFNGGNGGGSHYSETPAGATNQTGGFVVGGGGFSGGLCLSGGGYPSGGGGGAMGVGVTPTSNSNTAQFTATSYYGAPGGPGWTDTYFGTSGIYGNGGDGSWYSPGTATPPQFMTAVPGTSGTTKKGANSGCGGGGGNNLAAGGSGASGIVIIRYAA